MKKISQKQKIEALECAFLEAFTNAYCLNACWNGGDTDNLLFHRTNSIDDVFRSNDFGKEASKITQTLHDLLGNTPYQYDIAKEGIIRIKGITKNAVQATYSHYIDEITANIDDPNSVYRTSYKLSLIHQITGVKAKFSETDKQKIQTAYLRLAENIIREFPTAQRSCGQGGERIHQIERIAQDTEIKPLFSDADLLKICSQYIRNGRADLVDKILNITGTNKPAFAQCAGRKIPTATVQEGYRVMFANRYESGINYIEWLTGIKPDIPAMAAEQRLQETQKQLRAINASIPSSDEIAYSIQQEIANHEANKRALAIVMPILNRGYI